MSRSHYKTILVLTFLLALASVAHGKSRQKVIYGADNRVEVRDTSATYAELSRSTAALIKLDSLTLEGDNYKSNSSVKSLKDSLNLCAKEKFAEQPFLASCSGFLVGEDIVVTAGHCYKGFMQSACDDHVWVFGFEGQDNGDKEYSFPKENVYKCKKVIKSVLDSASKMDYSIIQLDRKVTDRQTLRFRKSGELKVGDALVVIGHPWGLPSKVADGAKVLDVSNKVFVTTNLDTFQGNSGSAVFNAETGLVEGILVRGKTDATMKFDEEEGRVCRTLNYCKEDGTECSVDDQMIKGEDVTRISGLAEELAKLGL